MTTETTGTTVSTTTAVFGIVPSTVTHAAEALERDGQALASTALRLGAAVAPATSLPGGQTAAALSRGAERVSAAVEGESVVVDVLGTDLHAFVAAVDGTEAESVSSLTAGRTGALG